MKRTILIAVTVLALAAAGSASAYALHTITLNPGHCAKVHGTRVCARKAKPKTVTVYPAAAGTTVSGSGTLTMAPFTLAKGTNIHWSYTPDPEFDGGLTLYCGESIVSSGTGQTSGTSYLPAGNYTCNVVASAGWSVTF